MFWKVYKWTFMIKKNNIIKINHLLVAEKIKHLKKAIWIFNSYTIYLSMLVNLYWHAELDTPKSCILDLVYLPALASSPKSEAAGLIGSVIAGAACEEGSS